MSNPVTITAPEGAPFITIEREFDFPVEAVFRAHADADLYTRWLGPRGFEMNLERFDFATGGGYRYSHRDPESGEEYRFRGVFHAVRENELIIQTFEYEGFPDAVSLETQRFESLPGGRSKLTGESVYPSVEARDGMIQSDMETGVVDGYEQLDELLAG